MVLKSIFITIHVGANFGSVLQTFATEFLLREKGVEATVLNYIPPRVTYKRFFMNVLKNIHEFPSTLASFPLFILNKRIYMGFIKKHCHLTKPYYSIDEIKNDIPKADFYISGSDQVWNSIHNEGIDEMYYYTYLPKDCTIFSFSSSFGRVNLSLDELDKVKTYLRNYKCISVREKSAQLLLESLGFENVEYLLDPTLLLNADVWKKQLIKERVEKDSYLLVFTPYNTVSEKLIYQTARKIAIKKKLKVVTFTWGYFSKKMADKTYRFAKPEDFLSLVYYADCVITNSFHGTAFSINFNKELWVYKPSAFSTRLISILELTGLKQRLLDNVISDDMISQQINWKSVNDILNEGRERADSFLKKALN